MREFTRKSKRIHVPLYALAFFLAAASWLHAEPPPNFNPASQIGGDVSAFRKETEPTAATAPAVPDIELPAEEEPVTPTAALKEFYVKKILVEGSKKIPLKELEPILSKFENKNLNLVKLRAIAKNITQYYRLKGYVTSRAFVPPQKIQDGIVVIRIVEGKLGKATVTGNRYFSSDWLKGYLTIHPGDVIQYETLQQDLVHMNRNPDRTIKAVLAPGEQPETSDIVLNVEDQYPMHFAHIFDNHGTRLSGRLRNSVQFRHSNLLGRDDALYNTLSISEGGDFVGEGLNYVYPLSPNGGRLVLSYAYSDVELGKELRPLNVKGGANIWGIGYLHPVADETNWSLDFNSGFDIKEVWSTVNGQDNSRDHLRVIHFGPNLLIRDSMGTTTFGTDFIFGIPRFLGGNLKVDPRSNREGGGGQFFVNTIDVNRAQKFFWDSVVLLRLSAQMTEYPLVSTQQFRAGGYDTVRGYGEGDSLGDDGFLHSTEWRVPPYFIPRDYKVPWRNETFWDAVQLVAFFDYAKVHLRNAGQGQETVRTLIGVGGGLRVNLTDTASFQADWGWPIGDEPEDGYELRLHFGLTTQLPDFITPKVTPKSSPQK